MKHLIKLLLEFFLFTCTIAIQAQSVNPASGGNATGTGGSISYSVGQIVYTTNIGSNGTVSQGIQQPYEISIVTALKNTEGITLECTIYPNPTIGVVNLVVKTKNSENLRFQLYDLNGIQIQEKKIGSEETEILMDSLIPSTYFLKVLRDNREIKTFKIIKN
jgi:hypothetical protein